MLPLYDAHNHYHDAWLTPHRARVFADLASVGLRRAVVNGTCETDWPDVAALAREFPLVLPSFGLHPWDAGNRSPDWQQKLLAHLDAHSSPSSHPSHSFPAAIGEIGLDRWILDRARPDDPRLAGLRRAPLAEQIEVFAWQLDLAAARNLPASIHCLDAFGPLHDLLRAARLPARGFLLHAYSGPVEMVKTFADLGAYFSFNGSFLDPRKIRLRELYAMLPADRLLVETDAPAMRLPAPLERFSLPPTADGSLPNHPANLAATYAALAELRGLSVESLAAQVEENFVRLFGGG
jgi:TatD DNase family protein